MEPANQAAAFFDLDRTLVAGSSGIYWARAAVDAGIISRRQMARLVGANVKFRLRGSTDESTDAIRERLSELVAGRDAMELRRMMPEVLAGVLPRL
ncbi:MAG: haloacid dehalogenase-like hydrolase, partial [Solirubrobacteraceae bacterium]|nr:haloacid dehalogenase-like hydrolase [Solirubrobacteraceae bacterium]